MLKGLLLLLACWPLLLPAANETLVLYDNTRNSLPGGYNTSLETGNELTFANYVRLGRIDLKYMAAIGGPGRQFVLRLYANDGAEASPGTLLYESGPMGSIPSDSTPWLGLATLSFGNVSLPQKLTLTFQPIGLQASESVAPLLADPPVTGHCADYFWQRDAGGKWIKVAPPAGVPTAKFDLQITGKLSTHPPEISRPADVVSAVGSPPVTVDFTVDDPDDPPDSLRLEAHSANLAVISSLGLAISGQGKQRRLTLTPSPGSSGVAIITIEARDTYSVATSTFSFAVVENPLPVLNVQVVQNAIEPDVRGRFVVSRTGSTNNSLAFEFRFAGTATEYIDYGLTTGGIIPAGRSNAVIEIQPYDDARPEPAESIILKLATTAAHVTGTNAEATLSLADDDTLGVIPPVILAQSPGRTAFAGDDVILSVLAPAFPPLDYQWTHNGRVLPKDTEGYPKDYLLLKNITAAQAGEYGVTVSGAAGETTSAPMLITVHPAPENNAKPSISSIVSVIAEEDRPWPAIIFSVKDAETPPEELTVTIASSDPILLPPENVFIFGEGERRIAEFHPSFERFGRILVSFYVTDAGGRTAASGMLLYVTANPAPAPVLGGFSAVTTARNQAVTIPFSVDVLERMLPDLVLAGRSSNPALVPNRNIVFGGSGNQRTVTLFPNTNAAGSATITILAASQGNSSPARIFQMTVATPNQPPIIAPVPDTLVEPGQTIVRIPVTVTDDFTFPSQFLFEAVAEPFELLGFAPFDFERTETGVLLTIRLKPLWERGDSIKVTLFAKDDEGEQSKRSFQVLLNDPPHINSILGCVIPEGQPSEVIFTVADKETPLARLQVRIASSNPDVIPPGNVWVEMREPLSWMSVNISPLATGDSQLTITIEDEYGGTTSTSFLVTVMPDIRPPGGPVRLKWRQEPGQIILAWPSSEERRELQQATNLGGDDWQTMNLTPEIVGGEFVVRLRNEFATSSPTRFFRLRLP